MNRLINVLKLALIINVISKGECEKLIGEDDEESRDVVNDMNEIAYTHESLDESIENDANMTKYENSYEIVSTNTTDFVDTTTIKVAPCKYQGNMSAEESDESQSTLVNFPYSVSIQRKGAHYASGALIGKRWILSSAGDFYNVRESIKLFRARLGSVDCKRGGILLPIKSITIHPSYTYKKPNFDISLLRMAIPVLYSKFIRPISLSNLKGRVASAKYMTTYWPRIIINNIVLPEAAKERTKHNSMRVSTQKMIPADQCAAMMKSSREVLDSSSLCLKPIITHHSVCVPDAGAPVIADDGLWGITSGWISSECPQNPGPTIFTRISSYIVRSWLDTQLLDL